MPTHTGWYTRAIMAMNHRYATACLLRRKMTRALTEGVTNAESAASNARDGWDQRQCFVVLRCGHFSSIDIREGVGRWILGVRFPDFGGDDRPHDPDGKAQQQVEHGHHDIPPGNEAALIRPEGLVVREPRFQLGLRKTQAQALGVEDLARSYFVNPECLLRNASERVSHPSTRGGD